MKKLNEFVSSLSDGVAKNSLMDVVITPPKFMTENKYAEFLTFRCESADLPGKNLSIDERKDYVFSSKHPNGVTFEDLSLTFLCGSKMKERQFFDEWMEKIVGTGDGKSTFYNEFTSNSIIVNLYSGKNTSKNRYPNAKTCSFTFNKIFPTTLAKQQVSWTSEEVLKLTVSFTYEYWTVEYY